MSKNKSARAEIRRSRSKKNPFKVSIIGANGEMLLSSELLSTRANCIKNIKATMGVFRSTYVEVWNYTGKTLVKTFISKPAKLNIN